MTTRSLSPTVAMCVLLLLASTSTADAAFCTVDPLALDFGSVELGKSATRAVTVTNPAGSPSRCTVNTITFDNPEFTLSPTTPLIPPFNVWPGNSVNVVVNYKPVDLNTDNNTMLLNIRDADRVTVFDVSVALTGTGVPPVGPADIDVSPTVLAFGTVDIGTTRTLTTTIRNLGGADLTVTGLTIVPAGGDFALGAGAPALPLVLSAGASAVVPVDYTPSDEGLDNGNLEIVSDDVDEPLVRVSLSGRGVVPPPPVCDIDVAPLALDFGDVLLDSVATLSTTIGNTGTGDCTVSSLTIIGSADFALGAGAPAAPFTLAPGASVDVPVDYSPSDNGSDTGTLEILSDDPDENPVDVALSGTVRTGFRDAPHSLYPPFITTCNETCHDALAAGTSTVTQLCQQCHSETPTLIPAIPVNTHDSVVTNSQRFTYSLECNACHHPHNQDMNRRYFTTYGKYIKERISETIDVTDLTQSPPQPITKSVSLFPILFTGNREPFTDVETPTWNFVHDDPSSVSVCRGCHTLTNHHRNESLTTVPAPGGQDHNNGARCTDCHAHLAGFSPAGGAPPPPHDTFDCTVCHKADLSDTVPGAAIPNAKCEGCHSPGTPDAPNGGSDVKVDTHFSDVYTDPATGQLASLDCVECHNPMREQINFRGNPNLAFVRTTIRGSDVAFEARTGKYSFAYDLVDQPVDMSTENYVCNTCHTQTNHHRNELPGTPPAPGGQQHNDGVDCTGCHSHPEGFRPIGGPHPQAVTDCSNCHLSRETGEPDLQGLHGNRCEICHTPGAGGVPNTFLGPFGTWNQQCTACHNPGISETGNLQTPTKGHRCVACHGQQRSTRNVRDIHHEHADKANCVSCHGFIPDVGTEIQSGNRNICHLCHGTSEDDTEITKLHKEMVPEGLSCLECHADQRPPVDVFPGPPVGHATHVCQVCHDDKDPSDFRDDMEGLHRKHVGETFDCGYCHKDAKLQDDRDPMPPIDDVRRQGVSRARFNECSFCHEGGRSADIRTVHRKHVAGEWQWCYNCHEGTDQRPQGAVPPVTRPDEACELCHGNKQYSDAFPFDIHRRHADKNKCYACHQTVPPLFDWPEEWMAP